MVIESGYNQSSWYFKADDNKTIEGQFITLVYKFKEALGQTTVKES